MPTTLVTAFPRLGALPESDGRTTFRVWAPAAQRVEVALGASRHDLHARPDGLFEGTLQAVPGDDYMFVLDGGDPLPDPCSRDQPDGLRGPSRVVELAPPAPPARPARPARPVAGPRIR